VSELLRENLYEFNRHIRENGHEPYFTLQRLKKITIETLEALEYIHGLNLVHCDIKPENIVMKSMNPYILFKFNEYI
jgi:serine/threonine protein kinase